MIIRHGRAALRLRKTKKQTVIRPLTSRKDSWSTNNRSIRDQRSTAVHGYSWPNDQSADERQLIGRWPKFDCYIGPSQTKARSFVQKITVERRTNKRISKRTNKLKLNTFKYVSWQQETYLQIWCALIITSQRTEEPIPPKDSCWDNQLPHCLGHE